MIKQKVYLIISIDTECDKALKWAIPQPMGFTNIKKGVPNVLQPLFTSFNIKTTYLLSPEIMQDQDSVEVFRSLEHVELGTHLHSEFVDPNANWEATRTKSIQKDLDPEIEKKKLENLTKLFVQKFGYAPLSFRAGRFGISSNTFSYLSELGYQVDSSITPFKSHYYESGAVNNFWGYRPFPFILKEGQLLQVPVTIINKDFSRLPTVLLRRLEDRRTILKRILGRLGYRSKSQWFRPYRSTGADLCNVVDYVVNTTPKKQTPVLNMMFHSNEILPGTSPYGQTQAEVDQYLFSLKEVFQYIHKNFEVCSIGLGEYANFFR